MPYYAVAKGRSPGIYTNWNEAKKQVDGFKRPVYKKFDTRAEAQNFMSQHENHQVPVKTMSLTAFFQVEEEPQEGDKTLIAFTDGSAINNGQKNCRSGYAVVFPYHSEYDFKAKIQNGTNNIAEFKAVIKAIEIANDVDKEFIKTLVVYTDSMLLINTVNKWMFTWKKNGWQKSDGSTPANIDLVKKIDKLAQTRKLSLKHVRAHTGGTSWEARWNDKVDKMAKEGALGNI